MKDYRFLRFPSFRDKALTLSYDDGVVFDKKLIEIMDKFSLKGTFNINSELFALKEGERRLTKQQAYDLYANSNHEIALHGAKHLSLASVSTEDANRDVLVDKINLEKTFNRRIRGMAYAYGSYNDTVVEILKNHGVKYARTVIATGRFDIPTDWLRLETTCHHTDKKLFEYVDNFLYDSVASEKQPKLFYLWGHSYEFNDFDNWDIIERFGQKLGNRSDIWYATNIEVFDYVKAFDNLVWNNDQNQVYNPSDIDVYLEVLGQKVLVPAGRTVKMNFNN